MPAWLAWLTAVTLLLGACQPVGAAQPPEALSQEQQESQDSAALVEAEQPPPTPFPTRPLYSPGELVDYVAQSGDTLPALAVRFNTSVEEILQANPFIPASATTMPPGMPMKIPIYYLPLWGSPYQIIPDSLLINGPAQIGFSTVQFVAESSGWLKSYVTYASDATRSGAEVVDLIAQNYSVSPRLLLALLEFQSGALSRADAPPEVIEYAMGYRSSQYKGFFMQLAWAANQLNNNYYAWRTASITSMDLKDGRLERFDPWQNAATVSLHLFFNRLLPDTDDYLRAIAPEGFAQTYASLFGDPWQSPPHIPGSLTQPEFNLPFQPGNSWAFTGGPHTGWGRGEPFSAIDFAPPSVAGGCLPSSVWVTAVSDGVVARSEIGVVVLDLDGDGDERTGWVVFYLHIGSEGRPAVGTPLQRGQPVGHPSCEGGSSTGTHVHIARKYNGEWMLADGLLGFNLEGWVVQRGSQAYKGSMHRFSRTVTACECSNAASFIHAER